MKNKKVKRRIRVYFLVIIALLAFFGYKTYYYLPRIYSNYKEKTILEDEYKNLLDEEETLSTEIIKLRDPEYIARYAREKYLYSKDKEIIIRIVE